MGLDPIIRTCSIFSIKGFASFCSESPFLPRHKNRRDLLMEDLLNIEGKTFDAPNSFVKSQGGGGILGNVMGIVMNLHATVKFPNDIQPRLSKTEALFAIFIWLFNQKEITTHLTCEEKREKCLSNIF